MSIKQVNIESSNYMKKTIKELNDKIRGLTEHLQRERADFINYKKRAENERIEIFNIAKQNLILEILPLLDNIERVLKHIPKELTDNEWVKGITQVAQQAEQILQKLEVKRIKAKGEHFDPRLHEALSLGEGDGKNDIVSEEIQTGYMINGKVLRPTLVKVIKQDKKGEKNG